MLIRFFLFLITTFAWATDFSGLEKTLKDWSSKKITAQKFAHQVKYIFQRHSQDPNTGEKSSMYNFFESLDEKCPGLKEYVHPKMLTVMDLETLGQSSISGDSPELNKQAQEEVKKAMTSLQEQKRNISGDSEIGNLFGSTQSMEFIRHRDNAKKIFLDQFEKELIVKLQSCEGLQKK